MLTSTGYFYPGLRTLAVGTQSIKAALLAVAFLLIGHLVLGASVPVVVMTFLALSLGMLPIARYGVLNLAALLLFLTAFRYVGFPIIGKLIMGQPLDSNLEQPVGSFLAVFLGMSGYFVALMLASKIRVGKPLLRPVIDSKQLHLISVLAALIGVTANLALAFRISDEYEGITVANFFVSFLHLSLIAGIAAQLVKSGGKRSISIWVVGILVLEVAFALVVNSRMVLVEILLAYIFTRMAFGARISIRWLGGMLSFGLIAVVLITPVMLQVRDTRDELSWTERIETTVNVVRNWRDAIDAYETWRDLSAESNYLQYYGAPQNVLERMSLINHIDVLKSGIDRTRQVGFGDLGQAIERALPRILAPDKPRGDSQGSWLYCEAGVDCVDGGYATAPLIANGYAAFGWAGVAFYPFLLGLPVLLLIKKAGGWNLGWNIWVIFLFLRAHDKFVEGSSGGYVLMILRDIPQDLVLLLVIAASVQAITSARLGQRNTVRRSDGI